MFSEVALYLMSWDSNQVYRKCLVKNIISSLKRVLLIKDPGK